MDTHFVTLDGRRMQTREAAHDELAAALSLPAYYGRNLDALHDCLTDLGQTQITLVAASALLGSLSEYGERLVAVLLRSSVENPRLGVSVHTG